MGPAGSTTRDDDYKVIYENDVQCDAIFSISVDNKLHVHALTGLLTTWCGEKLLLSKSCAQLFVTNALFV